MNGKKLLSNLKFNESYSKYKKDLNRKETWEESCEDVMSMHYNKFSKLDNWNEIKPYYNIALESYKNMEILASQRNLQFREKHILKHNARLYNCSSLYIDRIEAFKQIFYILLCGCGVGYSVEKRFIDKLPLLHKRNENDYTVHLVNDSIEGWSLALDALLNSYFQGTNKIIFDYSAIRPKGSLIAGEFLAPGHEGLEKSLNLIDKILQDKVNNNDFKLTSLNCHDIICLVSDSVLSGGVRRCLAGDSEVLTKKGLVKMKDILIGDEVLTHTGEYKKVIAKINNGKRKLLKITTNCGDYYSTENHVWATAKNLDGNINWKLASDLKKNDVFIYNNNNIVGIDTCLPKSIDFDVPELDTDMAWFIGYFLGNGSCSKRIRKNNNEDNKFRISYPSNYDLEEKIHIQFKRFCKDFNIFNKNSSKEITSSKKIYATYFLEHFKQPNTEILIPNCIRQAKEEIRMAFIAGLLDSDGSVREETKNNKGTGQISIVCSKYYNFCKSIQSLISLSGIPTKLKIDNRGNFFSVKTIDSYFRKILIEKLSKFSIKLRDDYVLNDITKEKHGIVYPLHLCDKKGQKSKLFNNNHIASYKKVYLDNNVGTGFIPVVIKNISEYKEDVVYDIEIEDNHSFFIDGVLTHNSALISLFDKDDELMLKCKTGDWWIKTPWRARANNSVKLLKSDLTKEEFDSYKESIKQFGEPGIALVDDIDFNTNPCFEIGFKPINPFTNKSAWSFCVAGDTKIITRNGIYDIKSLEDKEVEIWNGEKYSKVKPYKTGDSDLLHRVYFGDGSYLDATSNHKFLVKHRFEKNYREVETLDLINEIKISKYTLSVPRANFTDFNFGVDIEDAYEFGFALGDGTVKNNGNFVYAQVYENSSKEILFSKNVTIISEKVNVNNVKYTNLKFNNVDKSFFYKVKHGEEFTNFISKLSKSSFIELISGWLDADGSNASKGVRLYGEYEKLNILQLMLNKCGIDSSINLMSKKGSSSNLGERKNDVWYLQITKTNELRCLRLNCNNNNSNIKKGKYQTIVKIETLNGRHESYCLTEPFKNQCVFNNVLTKQCNLNEIIGSKCDTEEKFYNACKAAAVLGTFQASYTDFPFLGKDTEELVKWEALLGVSITGFMNNPKILLNPEILENGVKIIKKTNDIVAKLIGINPAARLTCTKP